MVSLVNDLRPIYVPELTIIKRDDQDVQRCGVCDVAIESSEQWTQPLGIIDDTPIDARDWKPMYEQVLMLLPCHHAVRMLQV